VPFIVDGSNLGGALAGAAGVRDRAAVVRRLLPWARRRSRVVVVFDGPREPAVAERYGALEVHFGGGVSADDVILRLLGPRAADWQVVTGDSALAAACRERGARVVSPARFLERLEQAGRPEGEAGPGSTADPTVDVEEWEAYFRRREE
jgi:hypothetical protein